MGGPDRIIASDIAQALLDITSETMLARQFDDFAACFNLPLRITTTTGPIEINTLTDMQRAYDEMETYITRLGVDEIVRTCVEAGYRSPDVIRLAHMTSLKRGGRDLSPPYPGYSELNRIDGVWKITGSEYVLPPDDARAIADAFAASAKATTAKS